MSLATDLQVRSHLKTILETASGANTSVQTRWKLSANPTEWLAVARSKTDNSVIDGWIITRAAMKNERIAQFHWERQYKYVMWYLRSVKETTGTDSSEYKVNQILDSVMSAFEDEPTLAFDIGGGDGIYSHSEFQVDDIDIVNDSIHVCQATLTVYLTNQPSA
jgi:hypothetical protein